MKTEDLKNYRKEQTVSLVEKYKSLIDDVFKIFDENVEDENGDDKKETEQKKLERIKKRSVALDQVNEFLDKIESLEHHLKESVQSENTENTKLKELKGYTHPTKARAKN